MNRNKIKKHKSIFQWNISIILLVILGALLAYVVINQINTSSAHLNNNHNVATNNSYEILEYNRGLKRVVISLSVNDTTLNLHNSLLLSFPEYTHIIL